MPKKISDCDNHVKTCKNQISVVGVLGLASCHDSQKMQVHGGDQAPLPPLWNSFVGTSIHNGPVPPATLKPTEENPRSFTSVQMVHTQYIYIHIYIYRYRQELIF